MQYKYTSYVSTYYRNILEMTIFNGNNIEQHMNDYHDDENEDDVV